jgi:hypothetical protein
VGVILENARNLFRAVALVEGYRTGPGRRSLQGLLIVGNIEVRAGEAKVAIGGENSAELAMRKGLPRIMDFEAVAAKSLWGSGRGTGEFEAGVRVSF